MGLRAARFYARASPLFFGEFCPVKLANEIFIDLRNTLIVVHETVVFDINNITIIGYFFHLYINFFFASIVCVDELIQWLVIFGINI